MRHISFKKVCIGLGAAAGIAGCGKIDSRKIEISDFDAQPVDTSRGINRSHWHMLSAVKWGAERNLIPAARWHGEFSRSELMANVRSSVFDVMCRNRENIISDFNDIRLQVSEAQQVCAADSAVAAQSGPDCSVAVQITSSVSMDSSPTNINPKTLDAVARVLAAKYEIDEVAAPIRNSWIAVFSGAGLAIAGVFFRKK